MTSAPARRRATLTLAFTSFLCIGAPGAALGVAWPSMRSELGRPLGDLGVVFLVMTVGYFTIALTHGALVRRTGPGPGLVVGAVVVAVGALGLGSGSWVGVLAGACAIGAGVGEVESGLNSHVALVHGSRAMNVMHGAFGVGAAAGPLAVTALIDLGLSWRLLFVAVAVVEVGLAAGFWATRASWVGSRSEPITTPPEVPPGAGRADEGPAAAPLPRTLLVATLAVFLVYVALETAVGQWSFTLLTEGRGVDDTTAGLVVSGFWIGLTVGRFVIGAAGHRVSPGRVLDVSITAALALSVVVAVGGVAASSVAVVLSGVALAGIFPGMVTLTPSRFGHDRVASVMGWQLAAASLGVGAGPALAAVAVEADGPTASAPVFVAMAVALLAVHVVARVAARRVPNDLSRGTPVRDVATAG